MIKLKSKIIMSLFVITLLPLLGVFIFFLGVRYHIINIEMPPELMDMIINHNKFIIASILIYLGVSIISIIIIKNSLSNHLIKPVKELNMGTMNIIDKNYDFTIDYFANNEIGELCNNFIKMKNSITTDVRKQKIYENSRKELVASITHDLKTPLTSIIGYVEGLQDGVVTDPNTVNNYLKVIHDKSDRLNHLIDDLFTFSQLELGKFPINKNETSMFYFLTEYINTKLREFESEELNFIPIEPIMDKMILVDEFRIGQVLENLIGNASKYAKSYIKLYTTCDDNFYNIFIEDDGIGISEDDLPYIFDYFYQCDKSRNTNKPGTGLGLAICKQIVESHDGKIYVKSTLNVGTTFRICLKC